MPSAASCHWPSSPRPVQCSATEGFPQTRTPSGPPSTPRYSSRLSSPPIRVFCHATSTTATATANRNWRAILHLKTIAPPGVPGLPPAGALFHVVILSRTLHFARHLFFRPQSLFRCTATQFPFFVIIHSVVRSYSTDNHSIISQNQPQSIPPSQICALFARELRQHRQTACPAFCQSEENTTPRLHNLRFSI